MKLLVEAKSAGEIDSLRREISAQMESGEAMDVDYWSAVVSLLRLAAFRATLRSEQTRLMEQSDRDVGIGSGFEGRRRSGWRSGWRGSRVDGAFWRARRWSESSVPSPSRGRRSR